MNDETPSGFKKVMVVLTDGQSNVGGDPCPNGFTSDNNTTYITIPIATQNANLGCLGG